MRYGLLSSVEDLEWLRDVHLKTCRYLPPYAIAEIVGNEDWPTKIILYEVDHVNSLTMELTPDENGVFHCNSERY